MILDYVRCSGCGKPASTQIAVEDIGIIVRAIVECPECVETRTQEVSDKSEFIANCVFRILTAKTKPTEEQRRAVAIANIIGIAATDGIEAAHTQLRLTVKYAEGGGYLQPEAETINNSYKE